jgi:hypothetical protein
MIATAPRATPTPMPVLVPLLRPEEDLDIAALPVELLLLPPAVTVTVAGTVPVLVVDRPVVVVSNGLMLVLEVWEDVRVEADLDILLPVLVVRADVVIVESEIVEEEEGAAVGASPIVVGARVSWMTLNVGLFAP